VLEETVDDKCDSNWLFDSFGLSVSGRSSDTRRSVELVLFVVAFDMFGRPSGKRDGQKAEILKGARERERERESKEFE
jgi:hypothetical protein